MASSSTAALGPHWQGPCPTWQTGPAHIQPRAQPPQTRPAVHHPPKHHPRSHPLSLSNWQLRLYSWIFFRAHSQPQFSHLSVSSSHHDPLSLAVLCQKSLAYSLPPGQEALLSFAQRDCNLSQALCQQAGSQSKHIQACQMQTYLSSHLLHYTSLSTFPSVVLLFLLSCMFQSPFLLPKSFFLYFIKEAPFCFMCQLLQTSIIFQ